MAKRPSSSRGRGRKSEDNPDDAFVARVFTASTWAQKNTQTLILLGIVLLVIFGGVFYYMSHRQNVAEQAALRLEQIQQTTAMGGDPETAKAELSQYLETFGGTPYASEARLALGELYLRSDQPEEALEVLSNTGVSLREPIGIQLAVLQAKAYEAADRNEEAEEVYLEVADQADLAFQRISALADAARLRERMGDAAGAADLYERILEDVEPSDDRYGLYEMRLAEARAQARS